MDEAPRFKVGYEIKFFRENIMPAPFKTIGILGRVKNPKVLDTLKTVIHYLLSLHQVVIVDAEAAAALNDATLTYAARETLCQQVDLLIIVGGDGSLLDAAHVAVAHETPVIGINRGRLGFLTDILPTELNKIKAILDGEYLLEKRFLLNATVEFQGDLLGESDALNEVALIPDSVPHMNEFEIYIDDRFVSAKCQMASSSQPQLAQRLMPCLAAVPYCILTLMPWSSYPCSRIP